MVGGRADGFALVVAILAMLLMSALGVALVLTTSSETMIAGSFRRSQEALYAADAAVERALDDLRAQPDWSQVLNGTVTSSFVDGLPGGVRTLDDGSVLDLTQVVNLVNCEKPSACSDTDLSTRTAQRPWGANNPVWRLYAYGRLRDMATGNSVSSSYYVAVLVADDPAENDGDPLRDGLDQANPGSGVLVLRAEAVGPRGARRVIEATIGLGRGPAGARLLSWREVR